MASSNEKYGKCYLRAYGVSVAELKYTCEAVNSVMPDSGITYECHTLYGDTVIEITYSDTCSKMAVDAVLRTFAEKLANNLYAEENAALTIQLNRLLKLRCKTISVSESFTAGRIAAEIISVPGASAVFHEGIVAYSNLAKELRLNVSRDTLFDYGAVSAECAGEMVKGLLDTGKCDMAISSTGIAGPASDDTNKPVGLCYIGVGTRDRIDIYKYNFYGTREEITATAVNAALFNAVKRLKYM